MMTEEWAEVQHQLTEEMDFTDTQMSDETAALLRELGLLREEPNGGPWWPTTAEDADWVFYRAVQLEREIADVEARAAERVTRLRKARESLLERYGEAARLLAYAELPLDKDGKPKAKTAVLDRVRVKFTSVPGGPKVADDEAFAIWLRLQVPYESEYVGMVKATRPQTKLGQDAIAAHLVEEGWKLSVDKNAAKKFVLSLPAVPHPETGELQPPTVPGVEWVEPTERMSFEA